MDNARAASYDEPMAGTIKTTVIGSYPVPQWVLTTRAAKSALRDALLTVLKTQELAGLDVVSDGELSRFDPNHPETNGMIDYFIGRLSGISQELSRHEKSEYLSRPEMRFRLKPAGVVKSRLGEGSLDLPEDWALVKGLTDRPLKFTVTSPYMLAKTLHDTFYSDRHTLTMELAEILRKQVSSIDAEVLQIDEAHLPGHPDEAPLAAESINHVFSGAQKKKGVHLCFGNYGGQSVQKGFWRRLMNFFNQLDCDHLLLEFARRGYEELEVFEDLKPEISLGVGVVDIKDNEVENPDLIASRIEKAARILGEERIRWVHPDCGFWMLPRSVADAKMRSLVQARDQFKGVS